MISTPFILLSVAAFDCILTVQAFVSALQTPEVAPARGVLPVGEFACSYIMIFMAESDATVNFQSSWSKVLQVNIGSLLIVCCLQAAFKTGTKHTNMQNAPCKQVSYD